MQPHYPYPPTPPRECVRRLLDAVFGPEPVPLPEALHCGWVLAGYTLSQVAPDRSLIGAVGEPTALAYLEHAVAGLTPGAVPWPVLIPLLVELILRLLGKKEAA